MSGITVTGKVLKTEHRKGAFVNDQGENIAYDFHIARVLAGDEVVEVKFKADRVDVQPPAKGADVTIEVELPGRTKCVAVGYADQGGLRKAV